MAARNQADVVLLRVIRNLRFPLPSRRIAERAFVSRSFNYVLPGLLGWLVISLVISGGQWFPVSWYLSLLALPDWFQMVVYSLLSLIMVWSLSYAVGLLMIISLRGALRYWLGKRITDHSKT
jgi:hypothetical protein